MPAGEEKTKKEKSRKIYIILSLFIIAATAAAVSVFYFLQPEETKIKDYQIPETSYRNEYDKHASDSRIAQMRADLKIDEKKYEWNGEVLSGNDPEILIYHHTALENIDADKIDKFHKERGWCGIGYDFFIDKSGKIHTGRQEYMIGAHTKGFNDKALGICLEGNFEKENPSEEQLEALEKLSLYLCLKYDIKDIIGHRDANETLCPGINMNVEEMKEKVKEEIKNFN